MNELCQKMSSPNQQSLAKLKRLARYLIRERQWEQVFEYGKVAEELTVFPDSDWAGCKETRQSSSAGVLMLGRTHLESIVTKAEGHCKEQRRGRTVCSSIGSVRSEGGSEHDVLTWEFAVKPMLAMDAKATEHNSPQAGNWEPEAPRCGVVQDEIRSHNSDCEALSRVGVREHG